MQPKIIFFGSPEYAKTILEAICLEFPVAAVVTQPDKPTGRGKVIIPSPVKQFALRNSIKILEPNTLRDAKIAQLFNEIEPDIFIVAAYGKILPKIILDIPRFGCINIHASLLPRWRGASPIQSAIIQGDKKTGVTLMLMDEGVDTGPILAISEIDVEKCDTGGSLTEKLAKEGAKLITEKLLAFLDRQLIAKKQEESRSTYCGIIKKVDGLINFEESAEKIERMIRAFNPWPVCYIQWKGNNLRIYGASVSEEKSPMQGHRAVINSFPAVGTATYYLVLTDVQPSGKKRMAGNAFLNGNRDWLNG